jgi:dipeptidyl aminopeptidase/acylaminoacyl peptidase
MNLENLFQKFKCKSNSIYVKNVPTLIIHGTGDMVVPYAQAELLSIN